MHFEAKHQWFKRITWKTNNSQNLPKPMSKTTSKKVCNDNIALSGDCDASDHPLFRGVLCYSGIREVWVVLVNANKQHPRSPLWTGVSSYVEAFDGVEERSYHGHNYKVNI